MIDPRAAIAAGAELDEGVSVGPFAVIGDGVQVGAGTWVGPHAVIQGPTVLGRDNRIFQFASVGEAPQDKKYGGEPTRLEIGDRNVIRECATVHRGTVQDAGVTRVGSDNLLMAYTHVAHDCTIGDHVILANAASLGGHITVGDWAILGGFAIVHQFCRIGAHCFCGMGSVISMDVPPYVTVSGHPAAAYGINSEGLQRRGFAPDAVARIRQAYKVLYKSGLRLEEAIAALQEQAAETPELEPLVAFLRASRRGIVR
ncbi:MAG: acyl-ACP--UDP-N-acetylglucosamine O-acyltransferase [Gammaproteobacteria bacterium]|nr:acyl-ACP--UDP-N-acetylglucosamine O-acyltransferase [Gammaproteobacteria bacterium]